VLAVASPMTFRVVPSNWRVHPSVVVAAPADAEPAEDPPPQPASGAASSATPTALTATLRMVRDMTLLS
jgi:hypothetical protein